MAQSSQRIISLAPEDDAFVEAQLQSGAYDSPSAVIGAGLDALKEQDAALDAWLLREVAPVYDAMVANPARGIPADQVFAGLRARRAERTRNRS